MFIATLYQFLIFQTIGLKIQNTTPMYAFHKKENT